MEMRSVSIVGRMLPRRVRLGTTCQSREILRTGQGFKPFSTAQMTWASGSAGSQEKKAPAKTVEADTERFRTHSVQDLLSLKGRVTVVTGQEFQTGLLQTIELILITGGARGIGLALARGTAELGSDVAVLDILEKPSEAFLDFEKDLGVRAKYYRWVLKSPRFHTSGVTRMVPERA